jgi:putative ABC transport system permease protein
VWRVAGVRGRQLRRAERSGPLRVADVTSICCRRDVAKWSRTWYTCCRHIVDKECFQMFLARRDLVAAKGRFLLMGAVVALIALLGVLLAGLATGLVQAGTSGLAALDFTDLALQPGAESTFSRSFLEPATVRRLEAVRGVRAAPLGVSLFNARRSAGTADERVVDVALFGTEASSFLAPDVTSGRTLQQAGPGHVVISKELAADGVEVGDTLTLGLDERRLQVAGVADGGTYGHVPVAFTDLSSWQDVTPGARDGGGRGLVSAVALQLRDGTGATAVERAVPDVELVTKQQSFDGSPGYVAEMSTMMLIRGFLLVISALVIAAFFTVWTVQRRAQIGLLKAMGASNGYVVRDALGQMLLVLVAATAAGTVLGLGLGALMPAQAPFSLEPGPVAVAGLSLVAAGLLGSFAAVRRITTVDPLIALGAQR